MKVLVTGVKGQLGYDVVKCLEKNKVECLGVDIDDFDITDQNQTHEFISNYKPSIIVHCSAYTAVDKAEDEKDLCYNVNVNGTKYIAQVCKEIGAKLIYISTDYVFSGAGEDFYEVDDQTGPLSMYGLSKLDGETAIKELLNNYFIIRISWVFGINGNNFVKTMLRLGKEREFINVVGDQIGSPTYTADLAQLIYEMLFSNKYGTYHATNEGVCSWAEFASAIMKLARYNTKINAITTEEYPTKAIRPKNSRLSKEKLVQNGFSKLPHWEDALKRYMFDIISINQ